MLADKHTHADIDTLITILSSPIGGGVITGLPKLAVKTKGGRSGKGNNK